MVRSWRSEALKVKEMNISLSVSVPGTLGRCVLSRTYVWLSGEISA